MLCGRPHWGAYLISKSPLAYNNKEDFYEKKFDIDFCTSACVI